MFWTLGKETSRAVNGSPTIGKFNKMTGSESFWTDLGKPKPIIWVKWECLAEDPVWKIFNSQLQRGYSLILSEAGYMESEWALFKISIVEFELFAVRFLLPVTVANHQLAYLRKYRLVQALVSQHGNLLTLPGDICQHLQRPWFSAGKRWITHFK